MRRASRLAALAAPAMLCAVPAVADTPRKVAIGPASPKGALLFKIPPSPVRYELFLIRVEEVGTPTLGHPIFLGGDRAGAGDRFVVESMKPGRYLLTAIHRQAKWIGCLGARTILVTIEPGRIAYLGTLDPRSTLASIGRAAVAGSELSAKTFEWHFYHTGVAPPAVSNRDAAGLAEANVFVREQMPKSTAAATLAPLQWASYPATNASRGPTRCD